MPTTLPAEKQFEIRHSFVTFQTNLGVEIRATLARVTRYSAVVELYEPNQVLRSSEVLADLKIIVQDKTLYSGRAVVRNSVSTGLVVICELSLSEDGWRDVEFSVEQLRTGQLEQQFSNFLQEWQKLYRVAPEYKTAVADLQTFLTDARLWLEQVELGIRSSPSEDRVRLENQAARQLEGTVVPAITSLFERFEAVAQKVPDELQLAHRAFAKRQVHPLLLTSPFVYRTFYKPLGYAGDYEMVNMMFREPFEGSSLFAKLVNAYALQLPPILAHRNRIDFLVNRLTEETCRAASEHRPARIFNLGCGPAHEVQRFLQREGLAAHASFTLMDFNDETLAYTGKVLSEIMRDRPTARAPVQILKKSVQQLLKQAERTVHSAAADQYDFIYCAGLFDYLSDKVCAKLTSFLYDMLAPGGLLLVTNVDQHPSRGEMECFLDWHLVYRNTQQFLRLVPHAAPDEDVRIQRDFTGVNMFLEFRKPKNAYTAPARA